jgi:xylulokinase
MFIGLDLGTSGVKGLLMSGDQRVLAEASAPLTVSRPFEGWSEQSPADWIAATEQVMEQLAAQGLRSVRGIGLSGQMHGATLLDAADEVLRPCILWNDSRSFEEAAELDADPMFRRVTGNIVFPGFTAPKLMWVQRHEPALWDRVAKVLLPKDYLRLWLTGDHVAEMSDASGTSWFDTGARDWSDDLLAATGLSRGHMPRLVEGSAPAGTLRMALAGRWGLPAHVVVAGGGGDNAASGVGVGVVRAGQAFVSLGTSGVLFAANDGYQPDPETAVHTFCHALPNTWHQMGVILSATDSLNWYAGMVGETAAALTGNLGGLRAPGKALFLPYLGGERTPLNSASVRGAFLGLEHTTDRAAGTRGAFGLQCDRRRRTRRAAHLRQPLSEHQSDDHQPGCQRCGDRHTRCRRSRRRPTGVLRDCHTDPRPGCRRSGHRNLYLHPGGRRRLLRRHRRIHRLGQ